MAAKGGTWSKGKFKPAGGGGTQTTTRKKRQPHHTDATLLGLKDAEKRYQEKVSTAREQVKQAKRRPGGGAAARQLQLIVAENQLREVRASIRQVNAERQRLGIS